MGTGFKSLPVQHDLFVVPGFESLALIVQFRPGVSLAYIIGSDDAKQLLDLGCP